MPDERILQLEAGATLEDLIEPGLWVDACNIAITAIAQGDYIMTEKLKKNDVRQRQRIPALKAWCDKYTYRVPEKLKLAETILELMTGPDPRADRRWLDPKRRNGLRAVHEAISGRFEKTKKA